MDEDVKAKAVNGAVVTGAASVIVRQANRHRTSLILVNDSVNIIYLSYSATAVLNTGIRLNAEGGTWEINATNLYRGVVSAIATGVTSNMGFIEVE
ncbi:hypothetical protein ES703_84673 [subsurface metagenome]